MLEMYFILDLMHYYNFNCSIVQIQLQFRVMLVLYFIDKSIKANDTDIYVWFTGFTIWWCFIIIYLFP